jgi:hypothetical protein
MRKQLVKNIVSIRQISIADFFRILDRLHDVPMISFWWQSIFSGVLRNKACMYSYDIIIGLCAIQPSSERRERPEVLCCPSLGMDLFPILV